MDVEAVYVIIRKTPLRRMRRKIRYPIKAWKLYSDTVQHVWPLDIFSVTLPGDSGHSSDTFLAPEYPKSINCTQSQ